MRGGRCGLERGFQSANQQEAAHASRQESAHLASHGHLERHLGHAATVDAAAAAAAAVTCTTGQVSGDGWRQAAEDSGNGGNGRQPV